MAGAIKVISGTAHPELARNVCECLGIEASPLRQLVVTDTIPLTERKRCAKIQVKSVASLFADAIRAIHDGASVSRLFR